MYGRDSLAHGSACPPVALDVASLVDEDSQDLEGPMDPYRLQDAVLDSAVRREREKLEREMIQHGRFMTFVGFILGFFVAWIVGL